MEDDETINMGNDQSEAHGGNGNDTINMGDNAENQEAHGGKGNDTIDVGGKDFKAYGEAGDDTFKLDSNDFKSAGGSGNGTFGHGGSGSGNGMFGSGGPGNGMFGHDGGSNNSEGTDLEGSNALIDGGEGLDTLVIDDGMDIDFSALSDNISNIETINLGDGAQNITSLSTEDVLNVTDTDNILRIDGDSSDSIELNTDGEDAEWTLGNFKTDEETGATYQEATGDVCGETVTMEISTDITIDQG